MSAYAEGATVERRYPGPDADAARSAAEPQIQAFLNAGFTIESERWLDDTAGNGAPIGDAIAAGPLTYLAGQGGSLAIVYRATRPTDLPVGMPHYTLKDPRASILTAWSQFGLVIAIVFVIIFLIFFLSILGQMTSTMPGIGI